jgi:hypothetical protein
MKILFDQGPPAPLRDFLATHTVGTAYERGWSTLSNGDLLKMGENAAFDLFITTDLNLRGQQNLSGRRLAVLMLPTTRWPQIRQHVDEIVTAAASMTQGEYRELTW